MSLPPLVFHGASHSTPPPFFQPVTTLGYAVEHSYFELPVGEKRRTWRVSKVESLCPCFVVQDVSARCCCAICCGGIYIWKEAVALLPHVEGEETVLQDVVTADRMRAASEAAKGGGAAGAALADVFVARESTGATFSRLRVRKQIFSVLFDDWKMEGGERKILRRSTKIGNDFSENCYIECCSCCATAQVVDSIQAYALERYNIVLKYGPIDPECSCCSLVTTNGERIFDLPPKQTPLVMDRM